MSKERKALLVIWKRMNNPEAPIRKSLYIYSIVKIALGK